MMKKKKGRVVQCARRSDDDDEDVQGISILVPPGEYHVFSLLHFLVDSLCAFLGLVLSAQSEMLMMNLE